MNRKVQNPAEIETRKLLIEHGLTVGMVAEHLGISPQNFYQRLKRGSTREINKAIKELDKKLEKPGMVA